ncbi:hypothetical protein MMC12_005265 [Toensbergia leucococca]|nr:hypothetical protein [Toensbergia leucococca]
MDTVDQNKAVGATVAGEAESSRNKNRSRTPGRVLVYDCDQRTLQVQNESLVQYLEDYKTVQLPPRKKEVTIFVDPETESKPTTARKAQDGHSNVMLAKIYLDRLGAWNQIRRIRGQLSILYVTNIIPWSETSSRMSSVQNNMGEVAL